MYIMRMRVNLLTYDVHVGRSLQPQRDVKGEGVRPCFILSLFISSVTRWAVILDPVHYGFQDLIFF